jgi:hypothetical protein
MYIIFGKELADQAGEKYTVLELDTIQLEPNSTCVPSYCLVEKEQIPLAEIAQMEHYIKLHHKLMENYRRKDWNFCKQALEHLHGRWGGTVNSFYDTLTTRINQFQQADPGNDWNGVLKKYIE